MNVPEQENLLQCKISNYLLRPARLETEPTKGWEDRDRNPSHRGEDRG